LMIRFISAGYLQKPWEALQVITGRRKKGKSISK